MFAYLNELRTRGLAYLAEEPAAESVCYATKYEHCPFISVYRNGDIYETDAEGNRCS